ncbi:Aste57867_4343 [Aphanomyces stellatus]|uniref:Aste57867_4343 protein n=1 Tax=Aphanomyces stellatus TaxID=120398 RepID=A0A485KF97_9STRA|nr:hypothetical protein As57867_004331 [Aphanomyces stellatus]VFT81457.1 Aste57867_4343 [Aphanomyces stellatus]
MDWRRRGLGCETKDVLEKVREERAGKVRKRLVQERAGRRRGRKGRLDGHEDSLAVRARRINCKDVVGGGLGALKLTVKLASVSHAIKYGLRKMGATSGVKSDSVHAAAAPVYATRDAIKARRKCRRVGMVELMTEYVDFACE